MERNGSGQRALPADVPWIETGAAFLYRSAIIPFRASGIRDDDHSPYRQSQKKETNNQHLETLNINLRRGVGILTFMGAAIVGREQSTVEVTISNP